MAEKCAAEVCDARLGEGAHRVSLRVPGNDAHDLPARSPTREETDRAVQWELDRRAGRTHEGHRQAYFRRLTRRSGTRR